MRTQEHQQHVAARVAHNGCQECRADCERRFLRPQWPEYRYIADYLAWAKPRLAAVSEGVAGTARWHQDFVKTLHRRITLKGAGETVRKHNDSYLQRMGQFPRATDRNYLRRFANRGASTLH